jgi:DinB superfamily
MPIDTASPPWSVRLTSQLDAADRHATALAGSLTSEQLNWRRSHTEWSVGQCLDHLCLATEVYLPPLTASLEARPTGVVPEIIPGWLGGWFIRNFIEPSPDTRRAKAPRKIVPAVQLEPSVLDRFTRDNQKLREFILRAASYNVNRIRFRNPFVPLLRFSVGTGLEVLVRHQARHLLQAERIREQPDFTGRAVP